MFKFDRLRSFINTIFYGNAQRATKLFKKSASNFETFGKQDKSTAKFHAHPPDYQIGSRGYAENQQITAKASPY